LYIEMGLYFPTLLVFDFSDDEIMLQLFDELMEFLSSISPND